MRLSNPKNSPLVTGQILIEVGFNTKYVGLTEEGMPRLGGKEVHAIPR